jgi:hypothetical protein
MTIAKRSRFHSLQLPGTSHHRVLFTAIYGRLSTYSSLFFFVPCSPHTTAEMHYLNFLYPALLAGSLIDGALALRAGTKIKLSKVQSLTLRSDKETSHRRVPAMPQVRILL